MGWRLHRVVMVCLYTCALGTLAFFAYQGADYYQTPLIERPRHDLYWTYKPGGSLGLRFGIIGTIMMTLMLSYSLRKRWHYLRHWGSMRVWLDYHIFFGICGPLFIVLHSSLKVQGLVSLSFWSMVAVALSGVLGRYLYQQIPRSQAGVEFSLSEVEAQERSISQELKDMLGLPARVINELDEIIQTGFSSDRSLLRLLLLGQIDGLKIRRRIRRFSARHSIDEPSLRRRFEHAVARKALLRRRITMWSRLRRIFHYWHVLHKPFAVILYLFMILHIAVAWMTGYV